MPQSKNTRKKYSEGSTNPEVVKDYYKSVNSKAEFFMKYPEAVDDYWDEDMTTISKNYGSSKEKVEQDVIDRINDLELKRGEDPLLEDTKRKGDRGGRRTKNIGGGASVPPSSPPIERPSLLSQGANTAYDMAVAKHNPMTAVHGIATVLDSRIDNPTLDKVIDPLVNVTSALNNVTEGILNAPRNAFQGIKNRIQRRRSGSGEEQAEREIEALAAKASRKDRADGGSIDDQMNALAISVEPARVEEMPSEMSEQEMIPDEQMEEDYVDYVMEETLSNEDRNYLISALEKDDRLSEIFDQVVESATEFSGSGPIEGPGNEKSDSIPARLSDGEFVITAKATEEIGADNLMSMMKDAEAAADERQKVAYGGMMNEEDQAIPLPTQGSRAAQGNVPNVVKQSRQVEEEMLKSSPRRYYVPVSG